MKSIYGAGGALCRTVALVLLTGAFGSIWSGEKKETGETYAYYDEQLEALKQLAKTVFLGFSKDDNYFLTYSNLEPIKSDEEIKISSNIAMSLFDNKIQAAFWDSAWQGGWLMHLKNETMYKPDAMRYAVDLLNYLLFAAAMFHKITADTFTQPVFEFKDNPDSQWYSYLIFAVQNRKKLPSEDYKLTGDDTTKTKISINLRENGTQEECYLWLGNPTFKSVAFSLNEKTKIWSVWPHDNETAVPPIAKTAQIIKLDANELAVAWATLNTKKSILGGACALTIAKLFPADGEGLEGEDPSKFIDFLKVLRTGFLKEYYKGNDAVVKYLIKRLSDSQVIDLDKYQNESKEAFKDLEKEVFAGFSKNPSSYLTDNDNQPVDISEQLLEAKFWNSANHGAWLMEQKSAAIQSGVMWLATDVMNFLLFTASVFHKVDATTFTQPLFVFNSVPNEQWFTYLRKTAKRDNKDLTWRDYNLTGKDTTKTKMSVNLRSKGDQKHRYLWLGIPTFRSIAFSFDKDKETGTWFVWPHDSDKYVPAIPKTGQLINLSADEFAVARAILNAKSNTFKVDDKEFSLGAICALAIKELFEGLDKPVGKNFAKFLEMAKKSAKKTDNMMLKGSDAIFDYLIAKF